MSLNIILLLTIVSICFASKSPRDFLVYRAHQIDLQGNSLGARSPILNLEGSRFSTSIPSANYNRKCVVLRLNEIDSNFDDVKSNAGGILIVVPPSLVLDSDRTKLLDEWEQSLMNEPITIPIYFVQESPDVAQVIHDLESKQKSSAKTSLVTDLVSDIIQFSVPVSPIALKNSEILVIESRFQVSDELPTVIISSYYDAYGLAPSLSFGADSNAGGVITSIQLMKLFSKLFADPKRKSKVNLVSLLSGGGKLNYWGTKKWLDQLEHKLEHNALLSNVALVVSLDSLTFLDQPLYVHSSSSHKPDTPAATFISSLQNHTSAQVVIKKINLAEDTLAWEHERFASRRLPSLTLSALSNHRTPSRSSIFDSCDKLNLDTLSKRITDIFTALQVVVYGRVEIKNDKISISSLQTLLDKLCSAPRPQQLLSTTGLQLVSDLESIVRKFSRSVTVHRFKPGTKEPEFTFYEPSKMKMVVYTSKPVVLDAILSACILMYLLVLYSIIINLNILTGFIWGNENNKQSKSQ